MISAIDNAPLVGDPGAELLGVCAPAGVGGADDAAGVDGAVVAALPPGGGRAGMGGAPPAGCTADAAGDWALDVAGEGMVFVSLVACCSVVGFGE